jgi:hypothetical protein
VHFAQFLLEPVEGCSVEVNEIKISKKKKWKKQKLCQFFYSYKFLKSIQLYKIDYLKELVSLNITKQEYKICVIFQ